MELPATCGGSGWDTTGAVGATDGGGGDGTAAGGGGGGGFCCGGLAFPFFFFSMSATFDLVFSSGAISSFVGFDGTLVFP